jgi:hypothetical protein
MANLDHQEPQQDSQDAKMLETVERDYREAKKRFDLAFKAQRKYALTRMALEANVESARKLFMELLRQRAELLHRLGKVR